MKRQSIKAALKKDCIQLALGGLVGCPAGGWGETAQAMSRLREALPHQKDRSYTVGELIEAALVLDHADRYQWRAMPMSAVGPREVARTEDA